jgi:hypothetical protein
MSAPCYCGRFRRGEPYSLDQCRVCWLYEHDSRFRALWGDAGPATRRSLPCVHLGGVIDRLGCACAAKWLRACALYGHCTLEACKTCPDYEAG